MIFCVGEVIQSIYSDIFLNAHICHISRNSIPTESLSFKYVNAMASVLEITVCLAVVSKYELPDVENAVI